LKAARRRDGLDLFSDVIMMILPWRWGGRMGREEIADGEVHDGLSMAFSTRR
jgi:hypothetical protein